MPFTKETLDFLMQNRLHDSRDWFNEHKATYNEVVLSPFKDLVASLTPAMLAIDDALITEPRVDRTISRIHRDTRFSKDKSLYRDNCWLNFMREKKLYNGLPAFYFEINPSGFSYGMGYYQASTASMSVIRELILRREPSFLAALEAFQNQDVFKMEGEEYKRSRHPDQPDHLKMWLDKKSFYFVRESGDFGLLYSEKLADTLRDGFNILAPVYKFLCAAESRKPQ